MSSDLVDLEIGRIADRDLRERLRLFAPTTADVVTTDERARIRSRELERLGFRAADALHVACPEIRQADVFLTTDDQVVRRAARVSAELRVRVANPLAWIAEVLET